MKLWWQLSPVLSLPVWWKGEGGCHVIFKITEGGSNYFFLFWRGVLSKFLLNYSSFSAPPPDNYCTVPYTGESLIPDVKQTCRMWWWHCTIMLLNSYTCLRWVVVWRQTSYSASVDVTIFERDCAYCDTGNFLEKSLQRLKKRRLEVKIF